MKHAFPFAFALLSATAAIASPPAQVAQIEVLPGWLTEDGTRIAALQITLAPGWKTYWRAPGDGGIPPHLTLSDDSSVEIAALHWPVPEVFRQNGLRSIGYHDGVVIPIEVTSNNPAVPMEVSGHLNIGVCEEICVPVSLPFQAALPLNHTRDTTITASLINRPLSAQEADVGDVHCDVTAADYGLVVTTKVAMSSAGAHEDVVIETGDPHIWVSEPSVTRVGDTLIATADMRHSAGTTFELDTAAVRITVLGSNHAVDILGCTTN